MQKFLFLAMALPVYGSMLPTSSEVVAETPPTHQSKKPLGVRLKKLAWQAGATFIGASALLLTIIVTYTLKESWDGGAKSAGGNSCAGSRSPGNVCAGPLGGSGGVAIKLSSSWFYQCIEVSVPIQPAGGQQLYAGTPVAGLTG